MFSEEHKKGNTERGAVLVLVALGIFFILGLAALVIDLGFLFVTRNQLHVAADSAALAGAAKLTDGGCVNSDARDEAKKFAALNTAASKDAPSPVVLDLNIGNKYVADDMIDSSDGDIVVGNFTYTRDPKFLPCPTSDNSDVNAVRVHARRSSDSGPGINTSGPVTTFFASALNITSADVHEFATAIGGVRDDIPICIPSCLVDKVLDGSCKDTGIALQPDNAETGVWTSFFDEKDRYDRTEFYIDNPDSISCIDFSGGHKIYLKNGGPTKIYTALDKAVNDDPDPADDGAGVTVSLSSPLPVVLPVCKWDGCAGTCSAGNQYGSSGGGAGEHLEVVGHVVFNITSVQEKNIGKPPRKCDDDLTSLPKGICGSFGDLVSVVANCSGLVE